MKISTPAYMTQQQQQQQAPCLIHHFIIVSSSSYTKKLIENYSVISLRGKRVDALHRLAAMLDGWDSLMWVKNVPTLCQDYDRTHYSSLKIIIFKGCNFLVVFWDLFLISFLQLDTGYIDYQPPTAQDLKKI